MSNPVAFGVKVLPDMPAPASRPVPPPKPVLTQEQREALKQAVTAQAPRAKAVPPPLTEEQREACRRSSAPASAEPTPAKAPTRVRAMTEEEMQKMHDRRAEMVKQMAALEATSKMLKLPKASQAGLFVHAVTGKGGRKD